MKLRKSFAIAAIAIGFSAPAVAGKAVGEVNLVYTQGDLIFASISNYNCATVADACGCSTTGEFALDSTTTDGKNLYAMFLTARALGATVAVTGLGTCDVKSDREDIKYGALTAN